MNRKIIGLLAFVAIFFMGDRLLSRALDRLLLSSRFRVSALYRGDSNADVLIFGNSRAVNSFYAPSIEQRFKTNCLNLAYNGLSPDVIDAMLLDYLDRNEAPQLLIVEVTCVDNKPTCISNLKPFWHRSSRLTDIARSVFPQSVAATKITRLFAFNCELFLRALSYRASDDQTWINRYSIDEELLQETASLPPQTMALPTEGELAHLQSIQATSQAHGIECQMVIGPYLPDYRRTLVNFDDYKSHITAAVGAVVDLSSALSETRFFADRLHTNFAGRNAVINAAEVAGVFDGLESR
jgi:hypothetical protein